MPIACNADKHSRRRNPRRSFAPIVVLRLNQTLLSVPSAGLRWLRRGNGLRSPGCDVPMTAEQAAFYQRLAEFKAINDPTINFSVLVAEKREREFQRNSRYRN